jgi:hypothetical protein
MQERIKPITWIVKWTTTIYSNNREPGIRNRKDSGYKENSEDLIL